MTSFTMPAVSALLDPADVPYLRLLEHCARVRRSMGLPAMSRAELEALLDRRGHPTEPWPDNVIPIRRDRRGPNVER